MSISNIEGLEEYDLYRILKLTTGETLMCVLVDQSKNKTVFEYPVIVEWVKIMGNSGIVNELSYMPYCPFAFDRTFEVSNNQIQHINNMNEDMIRSYLNLVHGKENQKEQNIEDIEIPKEAMMH